MKQEDWLEILDKHPSPEARIQAEDRVFEAIARGCCCAKRIGGVDPNCLWNQHTEIADVK